MAIDVDFKVALAVDGKSQHFLLSSISKSFLLAQAQG
jgi:hypothetical protein